MLYKSISNKVQKRGTVMLKSFTFRNCRSFKGKTTFSMAAEYPKMKDHPQFLRNVGCDKNPDWVLPVAAVYSSNAAGKSNLLKALKDLVNNVYGRGNLSNMPFILTDTEIDESFENTLVFFASGFEYEFHYEAEIDFIDVNIMKESLKRRAIGSNKDFEVVFVREGDKITDEGKILSGKQKEIIKQAAKSSADYLVVNSAGPMGISGISDLFNWCKSIIVNIRVRGYDGTNDTFNDIARDLEQNPELKRRMSDFIKKLSPPIKGVETAKNHRLSGEEYVLKVGFNYCDRQGEEKTMHLPMGITSNGTKKLIDLFPVLVDALDNGRALICDELDTMLHPHVFLRIVEMFNSKEDNPNNAQLIFAAHNTIVVNRENLRRDQINFVNINGVGESSVGRLADCVDENGNKVRMDASYDRLYLEGSFSSSSPYDFRDAKV